MAFVPRVGNHVSYLLQITYNGNPNYVKRRSARITATTAGADPLDLQVGHHGETYAGINKRTDPDDPATGVYVPY
jgi:hypothetical protein